MTDEQVLAGCRVLKPAIFRYGLAPLATDGDGTRKMMAETERTVRAILAAALYEPPFGPPLGRNE
jgi:hypothetical protein